MYVFMYDLNLNYRILKIHITRDEYWCSSAAGLMTIEDLKQRLAWCDTDDIFRLADGRTITVDDTLRKTVHELRGEGCESGAFVILFQNNTSVSVARLANDKNVNIKIR